MNWKNILIIKKQILDIFRDCKSLSFEGICQNIYTKYLKTIYKLFYGTSSLIYIDDISNWNTNNINDMSFLFYGWTSLK